MPEIKLGALTLVGESYGGHIRVSVLGDGAPQHRPMCGSIILRLPEWQSLAQLDLVLVATDRVITELQRRLDTAEADAKRLDEMHLAEIRRLDGELARLRSAQRELSESTRG